MQKAAQEDLILDQMAVKTAYLHGPTDCEICVDQSEGYEKVKNRSRVSVQIKKITMV